MDIGKRIVQLRTSANMSQIDLAERIGVTKQNLYKYEKGIITNIPSDKIAAIADVFGVSPAFIMGWDQDGVTNDKQDIVLSDHETNLIISYRNHPEMQLAVDRILGIYYEMPPEEQEKVYKEIQKMYPDE